MVVGCRLGEGGGGKAEDAKGPLRQKNETGKVPIDKATWVSKLLVFFLKKKILVQRFKTCVYHYKSKNRNWEAKTMESEKQGTIAPQP